MSINTEAPVTIENSILISNKDTTVYINGNCDVTLSQCIVVGKTNAVHTGTPNTLLQNVKVTINGGFFISKGDKNSSDISAAIVSFGGDVTINNAYLYHPQYALLAVPLVLESEIKMDQCNVAGRVVTIVESGKYTDISGITLSPVSISQTVEGTPYTFTNLANGAASLPLLQ